MDAPNEGTARGGQRGWSRNRRGNRTQPHNDRRNYSDQNTYEPSPAEQARWHAEAAVQRTQQSLFQMGDADMFDSVVELPKIAYWLEAQAAESPAAVFFAFRVMATEQPHKTPLIAALLGQMVLSPSNLLQDGDIDTSVKSLGMRIVDDLMPAFTDALEAHYWRNARLLLHLFTALVPLGIVEAQCVRSALQAFAAVLESGADISTKDAISVCIMETLCRGGTDLYENASAKEPLDALVEAVSSYAHGRPKDSALCSPFALEKRTDDYDYLAVEGLTEQVAALQVLQEREYKRPAFLPTPLDLLPPSTSPTATVVPLDQRRVKIPHVDIPLERSTAHDTEDGLQDTEKPDTGKGVSEVVRNRVGPKYQGVYGRWFGEAVPLVGSPGSIVLRALVQDIVDLYVANRKECAQTLLALPLWLRRGTFGGNVPPFNGIFGDEDASWASTPLPEGQWSLEDFLVETVLSITLLSPRPPQNELYYSSLLREIVSAAPQQVAPSLGRTVRRLYTASAACCVHGETLRRLADWFSVHLSNFNFTWAWSEWIPDADLVWTHARRAFARRVCELEVRLAYYDRIKNTVPEELQASLLPPEEPAPIFAYAPTTHPYHTRAMQLLNSFKAKASLQVVQADLQSFHQSILAPPSDVLDADDEAQGLISNVTTVESIVRDIAMQTLLFAGSRSFSHLLNMIERYHELLRSLSQVPQNRLEMLGSTARFWARSPQWVLIVIDKLLQYRIVEPVDVVQFVFETPAPIPRVMERDSGDQVSFSFSADATPLGGTYRDWSSCNWWSVICLTVDKVIGRVDQLEARLAMLLKEEAHDAQMVNDPSSLPSREDKYPLFEQGPAPQANTATSDEAKVHLDAMRMEQRRVLVTIVSSFAKLLASSRAWEVEPHDAHSWQAWWIKEWFREFAAKYHSILATNRETVLANVFALAPPEDPTLQLFEAVCSMP
ncbi:Nuclear cap-binding protein subunit 1 [Malassezia vespertilionis]|uniref:MIF4G domain-containing protein n=1 Tax=Malassezia vespertilionis TaxID=2020962 RepID=A0A2N1JC97_9BASI|nr:Nuclear cap-binding protein subunit 1 [Malassezia vespertilionis]PKI84157.1 hypothetical protein MVES_002019 [Malassezia vespertilionis]WFD06787.1 Nuclear cap-binding protein subunit 1 [Malassezia vespertilionis]